MPFATPPCPSSLNNATRAAGAASALGPLYFATFCALSITLGAMLFNLSNVLNEYFALQSLLATKPRVRAQRELSADEAHMPAPAPMHAPCTASLHPGFRAAVMLTVTRLLVPRLPTRSPAG